MAVTRSKMYELVRASGSRLKAGDELEVGGRKVKINRHGNVRVRDAGLAEALIEKYGPKSRTRGAANQLIGAELETYNQDRHADPVRRTHCFTMPAMPWHKYKDGKRVA